MKTVNIAVALGLLVSGSALVVGYLFVLMGTDSKWTSLLFSVGTLFGWLFGVAAILLFVTTTVSFLAGYFTNYWSSLYPVNMGLTVLGITSMGFRPDVAGLWMLAIVVGLLISMAFHRFRLGSLRLLPVLIALPLLLPNLEGHFNQFIQVVIGMIFVVFPFLPRFFGNGASGREGAAP